MLRKYLVGTQHVGRQVAGIYFLPTTAYPPTHPPSATKALNYPISAAQVCANLLEPPAPMAVDRAVRQLIELDALEVAALTIPSHTTYLSSTELSSTYISSPNL